MNQVANGSMSLKIMSKRRIETNAIAVSTPIALTFDHSARIQFSEYFLHGSLCDPYFPGHIAHAHGVIRCETKQHVGVIGEKRPRSRGYSFSILFI